MKNCRAGISPAAAVLFPFLYYLDDGGWFASALPTVVLHELGHCAAILLCGGSVRGFYLDVAGFRLDTVLPLSPKREAVCALAGPVAGLMWCGLHLVSHSEFIHKSVFAAILLNFFNLLPAYPLDGGRILYALFESRRIQTAMNVSVSGGLMIISVHSGYYLLLIPAVFLLRHAFIP